MTFALAVRDNEKSRRIIMRRLINHRSGIGESTKFTRQPDNRIRVRRLRALDAYSVHADRLQFCRTRRLCVAVVILFAGKLCIARETTQQIA